MLELRDIMTTDVITVGPDTPLAEVAQLLAMEGISGVPVVMSGRVLGVVSTTDLMDFSASNPGDDGRGGVWSAYDGDVDRTAAPGGFFTDGWPPRRAVEDSDEDNGDDDPYGEYTAGDIMTRSLFALAPHTSLEEAGRFLLQRGIHRVLVVDDGRLVGIATSMDFVKVVAHQLHGAPGA